MPTYRISIGSNVSPEKNIPECLRRLKNEFPVIRFSSIYETPPFGPAGDINFWNLACAIETDLTHDELRQRMTIIEKEFGRKHDLEDKFAPRTMDLDILPKPGYQEQAFVIIPIAEIDPDGIDALSKRSFKDIAEDLEEDAKAFKRIDLTKA